MRLHQSFFVTLLVSFLLTTIPACEIDSESTPVDDSSDTGDDDILAASLTLRLLDCNEQPSTINLEQMLIDCPAMTNVSYNKPGTLHTTLLDSTGNAAVGEIIQYSTSVSPISALSNGFTDSKGMASQVITVTAATNDAGTITASSSLPVENSLNFQVSASDLSMNVTSGLTEGASLAFGSNTLISVAITDSNDAPVDSNFVISFDSPCLSQNKANMATEVVSQNGIAATTYETFSCSGEDKITATSNIEGLTSTITLDIDSVPASSIQFVKADPEIISIKNSGGTEASILTFKVVDQFNNPVANQEVSFELVSQLPGIAIVQLTGTSNELGEVNTVITSGTTPAVVHVKAWFDHPTVTDTKINTVGELSISTGFPDNDSFSIALSDFNPEGLDYNGVKVGVTVQLRDHKNTPIPDGTVVNFETEGGGIDANCSTIRGACSVDWTSGYPKPTDGKITILAYTVGEEYFKDSNATGLYEKDDDNWPATLPNGTPNGIPNDIGEAYRDDDESRDYTVGEEFHDFTINQTRDAGNGIFNGRLCSASGEMAGTCSPETVYIYRNIYFVMSGSTANISLSLANGNPLANPMIIPAAGIDLIAIIADKNGNSMPGGTSISISTDYGTISGDTSASVNNMNLGVKILNFTLKPAEVAGNGKLSITVVSPKGIETPVLRHSVLSL